MDPGGPSDGHTFGQKQPPLFVTIQKILDKYPDGQIFKEIIQNADDAGASTVHFYLDSRQHGSQSLINRTLAQFQGPALLSYNDATFQDKDWQSIQDMQQSVKADDPFKVGKFGIGFNSVYHITDLPTIVSGNRLAYLDPHEEIWARTTGRWYEIRRNAHCSDTFAPFERLCGFSAYNRSYNGTLFRFPLRSVSRAKRVSSHKYDIEKLRDLLTSLRREAKCILLFLRSVRTVKVFEIGNTGTHSNIFSISISEVSPHNSLSQKHSNFQANLQRRYAAQSYGISDVLTEVVHVQVDFNDYQTRQTDPSSKWLVATQVGSPSQEVRRLAKDLKAFPWVGVALGTGASSGGGRVYCTLPMPLEVMCNLPVHVNGTFSLNDERRELKWRGIERQNDPSALWNHLLVRELLPACYAMLLLDHAKLLLEPDRFCEAWPDTNKLKRTPWEEMLTPLLRTLFSKEVIPFSKPGGFHSWIKVSSAVFVPRGVKLHAAVTTALVACGVKLVTVKDRIWNALTFSNIAHNTISPSLTRAELRKMPLSYSGLSSQQKLELLRYCLSDNQYHDLQNIALVPLANGTFGYFGTGFTGPFYYLCTAQCPKCLLPNLEGELVDDSIDRQIYAQLKTIASGGYSNLQVLNVNSVATLLRRVLPNQNKLTLPYSRFDMQWLEQLWYWIPRGNLHLFQNMPLVPVSGSTVVSLSKASSTLFIPSSTRNYGKSLINALQKLGVECCLQENHPFVHHSDIPSLMNIFSSEGIIGAIYSASPSYSNISFTNDEAAELIMQVHSTRSLNPQQQAVLRKLPMFLTLKNTGNRLYSVAQVERTTGRVAQIEPPHFPLTPANLPQSAILFSGSIYQKSLLQNLSVNCAATVDILTRLVFPEIEREKVGRNAAKKIMKEVLEKYNAITSSINHHSEEALQQAIGRLPFVPVSVGRPKAPIALYTPLDHELSRLFYQEPVFPLDPFAGSKYVSILKSCGLKTTVSKQEVMDIISSIGCPAAAVPVRADEVKYVRAKAILTYIRKWECKLNESVYIVAHSRYQQQRISDALKELSVTKAWLPVQSSPPKKYPSCLSWKGSGYNSHFVSFGASVLLHKEQASLAFACGSQMYFVEHSLPNAICKAFEPSPGDMIRHIMAHLERVILSCNKFSRNDDMRSIVYTIYEWLNKYSSEGHALDLSKLEKTKDCVWLTRQRKFVHPHNVALAQNPQFRQNLEPFIYILPDDLAQFESLFKDLEVQEIVTREQILGILSQIKEGDSQSLGITSDQAWQLVMAILHWLTDDEDYIDLEDLLVPVKSEQDWPALVLVEDVVYTDNSFLQDYLERSEDEETDYTFVHSRVTPQMAEQLQLTPLSRYLKISEDAFEDVGQSEPLTVRLKNILKDYKDGLTIIKELLQNADDAGATEMNICHDKRHHTDKRRGLFFPGMTECHGPALVVNNNAMFTEEDFVNITKLAGATKEGKSLKIGKFGIGFCSVYHITDVPSFVSSELLYIFDPTLKYLKDEIKNPARPGKKLCFTSLFIRKSKQLAPYVGLFDFDPKKQYERTTFRFPFRTAVSELSEKIYTDHDIKQLMEQMQKSSSKLILFLQNIESITFSEIEKGQKEPRELMRITKDTVDEDRCIYKISCSANDSSEYWLVATNSKTVLQTASVACSLSPLGDETCYKARKIEGETFCFLPLSIKTGLPVHISGNFAVINNRRGIWTSDDSDGARGDEVKWNVSLMKTVICSAYCGLLETLKELKCDSQLEEYKYYSMWPIEEELLVHNPWYCLVEELYRSIADSELFFSDLTDRWLTLYDSKFLDPDILRVSYNTPFPSAVLEIVTHIELPVVHLPEKYHKHLDLDESIETEKTFLEHFFDTIEQLEDVLESRNDVLCLALECYASELDRKHERFRYLDQLLKGNACVPCAPDGKELKKPEELIHSSADFAKLFDVDENVFPLQKFCDKVFVDKAMKELGIIHDSIPITHLEERATGIAELHKVDGLKAMERAQLIIECLVKEDKRETFSPKQCSKLSQTPFLPIMEKPGNYILQWTGQTDTLYRGCDIFRSGRLKDDITNISLAGSQLVFLNQEPPSKGGCGIVGQRAQTLLQIGSFPSYTDVISHFHHLIEEFDGPHEMIELADRTSRKVYEFLEKLLAAESEESEGVGPRLAEKPCIWTGQKFVESKAVASRWNHNGPYLFKVPNSLDRRRYLRKALKIREHFDAQDMVGALQCLKRDFEDTELPDGCQELVKSIIVQMASIEVEKDLGPVMLPDTEFVLHEATQLYHNDMPWAPLDDDYCYVHHTVPLKTAVALGVQLCRTASLAKYSVDSEFLVMEFGQHEELTKRIQNIIRDYPCDMTILKELLQNADDAKATKMHVILDMREHSKEHLLSEKWSDLQGPALLVWNDSVFTDDDLIGIQRLGLGNKRSDSETIGQYGIGFNAVYHLTDCPSFLTGGNRLCILDPHMMYVQHGSVKHPGEMYAQLDEKFWKKFDGIKSSYLRDGLKNVPKELLGGTLFRFPLRHTMNHVRSSDIVKDLPGKMTDRMISGQKMCDLLEGWAPSMKQTLLFLNNVTELKFSVIRDRRGVGLLHLQNGYTAELDATACERRSELTRNIRAFDATTTGKPFITTYPLTIIETVKKGKDLKEEWLIQQGIGDMENSVKTWSYVEQVKPRHGIAAPLRHGGDRKLNGQVFCFLPLPLYSGLPVHINGHFILDSTRRNLWVATDHKRGDDKSHWNENILQALASSYAQFLERIPEYYPQLEGFGSRQSLELGVMEYYANFPRKESDKTLSEPWLTLANQVFQILSKRNSPVLAVPTNISPKASEDKYVLQWQPLRNEKMAASQVYFPQYQENHLILIFERIGMKITCAPKWIMKHIKAVKCDIPELSQSSIFKFYIRFYTRFISAQFPCPLQDTPFKCVKDFKAFTNYLLTSPNYPLAISLFGSSGYIFPKEPFGYPLLLNAAEQLCVFDQANKILCSKHYKVFPSCQNRFLHPELCKCSYSTTYFISATADPKPVRVKIVKELLQTILPKELKNMYVPSESDVLTKFDVKSVWSVLSEDQVFGSVLDEVLKVWALLLTKDKRLFRYQSPDQLRPIIKDTVSSVTSVIEQQLKAPILDNEIVPTEAVDTYCPRLSKPVEVLQNLVCLQRESPFSEVITVHSAGLLINYFSRINLAQQLQCCQQLMCLPLFETMDGNLTILQGKKVYVWPVYICQKGNKQWLMGTDLVFLNSTGAWSHLRVDKELGIQRITPEETYMQFIFPKFFKMSKSDRYSHLKYIRDTLFDSNFAVQKSNPSARQFIAGLTNLQCIGEDGEPLKPVSHFYTHQKKIFQTFPDHFQTLPEDLLKGEVQKWMPFFRKIGLQETVKPNTFVSLCQYVANGKLKEKTVAGSEVLLDYLFKHEEAKRHKFHENAQLLNTISQIGFVCPARAPELEWIHKVPPAPSQVVLGKDQEIPLCKLSGSCISEYQHLLWAIKPTVKIPDCQKVDSTVFQSLGVCAKPTANDLIASVKLIAKTCFSDSKLFIKYTAPQCKPQQTKLMDAMAMIYTHLQKFKDVIDFTELKSLNCIPVYAISDEEDAGQYPVLVEPQYVVFRSTKYTKQYYPFIHSIHSSLYMAREILEKLGIQDSLELEHMQLVLESAFITSESGTVELEPNTMEVVSCAVVEMNALLEKNKNGRQHKMEEELLVKKLKPLYLSGTDKRMHPVDSLVYTTMRRVELDGTDLYVLWTPKVRSIYPDKFCKLLPKALRPRSLSHLCIRKVSKCVECEDIPRHVDEIIRGLNFPNLPHALSLAGKSAISAALETSPESERQKLSEELQNHVENFFESLEIHCVTDLKVDFFLKDSDKSIPVAVTGVVCELQVQEKVYHLYIDSNIKIVRLSQVHERVVNELASCLKGHLKETDIDNLKKFITELISADSQQEIYSLLQDKQINFNEEDISIDEPRLGDTVPKVWHPRLDMSNLNIFHSQEWVAYQPTDQEDTYIFAQVSHPVRLRDSAGQPLPPTQMEYVILTSEDDMNGKKVKAIDLYKFVRGETAPDNMIEPAPSETQEIVPFEGDAEEVPPPPAPINLQQAREEVRKELEEIWRLPQDDRKKAIRRLFLKWHPDKNPQNPELAEEVFKFIQNELDRLEKGDGVSASDNSGPYRSWRTYQPTWNSHARQHKHYQEEQSRRRRHGQGGRGSGGGGGGGGGRQRGGSSEGFFSKPFTPPTSETKAKLWARQAVADHSALQVLMNEAQNNPHLYCHVCFVAHEVAEKALKGAMFIKCGLRHPHTSHNIIPLAYSVEQVEPDRARGLSILAEPLESTFCKDTRFPKDDESSCPFEKFTLENAVEAEKCATGILKIVRDIVNV